MTPPDPSACATGTEALAEAARALAVAGIDAPARDARWLLAHALGVPAARLTVVLPDRMPAAALSQFRSAISARTAHQPVAQIIGQRSFWGRSFRVTPDVLDPRPETETLIAAALARPFRRVLDLGTGSGAIILTLLADRPEARGAGVDMSEAALQVARDNAAALGVLDRVVLLQSDWCAAVTGRYDLIVSNPPYIAQSELAQLARDIRDWEPHMALVPQGDDGTGLAAYRRILAQAPRHLDPGGWLLVEIGASQGQAVRQMFLDAGLVGISVQQDMNGHDRIVLGQRPDTGVADWP